MTKLLKNIFPWSLLLIGIVLVVRDQLIAPFILISFVSSIPLWRKPTFDKALIPVIALMLLFVWYLVGLSFSENMNYGLKDIESKLSFLLFPVLFLFTFRSWTHEHVSKVRNGLIIGVVISLLLSFGRAFWCKMNGGEICFRNDQFGFNMHATYLSVIYIMSVFFVFEKHWKINYSFIWKAFYLILVLIAIYFMRSLSSFVAAAVLGTVSYGWFMIRHKKWIMLSIVPILLILGTFVLKKLPAVNGEIRNTVETVKDYQKDPDDFIRRKVNWNESNTVRIVVWNFSYHLISQNPMGVGTGDVKDELYKVYRKHGYDLFAEKELNPHNQFFQTGIAIGVGAMFLLAFILISPFILYRFKIDPVHVAFLILILLTCLFESFLERQAGIIFFAFLMITFAAKQYILSREKSTE